MYKKTRIGILLFFFFFSFLSIAFSPPLLAEETTSPESLIKTIEINQALSFDKDITTGELSPNENLVAGKDTAILVRLSRNMVVNNDTQKLEVYKDDTLLTTLNPSPQQGPTNCLIFEADSRDEVQRWAAGNYKFVATLNTETLERVAEFKTRKTLNVLAVGVKANYGGEVKDVTGNWKKAGNYTNQLYPLAADGFNWILGQDLDCSGDEYDLKTDEGQKKLWEALTNLQVKDETGQDKYELIIGFVLDRQGADGTTQGYTYGKPTNIVTESDEDMLATVSHEIAHCYGVGDEYSGGSIRMSVNPAPMGMGGTDWDSSENITADNPKFIAFAGESGGEGSSIKDEVPFDFGKRQQFNEMASFMGSGGSQSSYWITAPIWKQLFNSFEPAPATAVSGSNLASTDTDIAIAPQQTRVIDVSAWISKTDAVDLSDPWYAYDMVGSPELNSSGSYSVQALDSNGIALAEQKFDLKFISLGNPPKPLDEVPVEGLTVPFPTGTCQFVFTKNNQVIGSPKLVSTAAPVINITAPTAGQSVDGANTITWTASDADDDSLTYEVLYSHNGTDWISLASDLTAKTYTEDFSELPGGPNSLIKVVACDGVNCTEASSQVSVTVKNPEIYFYTPEDPTVKASYYKNEEILLEAEAYDYQDDWLGDASLVWTDTTTGAKLGEGCYIYLDMAPGDHSVTLTATNSAGKTATQVIEFNIKNEDDPEIFNTLPNAVDEIAVAANKVWRIKLNQAVSPSSVTADNVFVSYIDSSDEEVNFPVEFSFENDNKTIVVSPQASNLYQQGEHYTLWIKDLKTANGKNLKTRIYRDFTVN